METQRRYLWATQWPKSTSGLLLNLRIRILKKYHSLRTQRDCEIHEWITKSRFRTPALSRRERRQIKSSALPRQSRDTRISSQPHSTVSSTPGKITPRMYRTDEDQNLANVVPHYYTTDTAPPERKLYHPFHFASCNIWTNYFDSHIQTRFPSMGAKRSVLKTRGPENKNF